MNLQGTHYSFLKDELVIEKCFWGVLGTMFYMIIWRKNNFPNLIADLHDIPIYNQRNIFERILFIDTSHYATYCSPKLNQIPFKTLVDFSRTNPIIFQELV